jgi:hypothetical protein
VHGAASPAWRRTTTTGKTEVAEMDTITRIVLCVIILGGIIALLFMGRSKTQKFDERQLIYRGRAVSLAFGTLITCLGIVLLLNTPDLPWLDVPMFVIISIVLSLTVFIVYSILHDAYFSAVTKKGSGGIVFLIIALMNIFNGIRHVFSHTAEDIYDIILPVVIGTMLLVVCATLLYKRHLDKKELDEE